MAAETPAPVALDAAIREGESVLAAYDGFNRDHSTIIADMGIGALRSLLSALSADRRLEEADGALTMLADRPCAWEGSEQHDYCAKALTANVCSPCIARRYFAAKGGER